MKKIKKEITTYEDVFVSKDGKEFNNEPDCKAWEKSYQGTLEASIKGIHKIDATSVDLFLPWNSDDHEVWVLKPQNLDEIALINAYTDYVTNNNASKLTAQMIGKEVALNFGYERYFCDVYVLEEHIENVKKAIGRLVDELSKGEAK